MRDRDNYDPIHLEGDWITLDASQVSKRIVIQYRVRGESKWQVNPAYLTFGYDAAGLKHASEFVDEYMGSGAGYYEYRLAVRTEEAIVERKEKA